MPPPPRITLDRRIPFVSAVFDVIEKRADSSRAVEILQEAERNHRLKVLFCGDSAGPPSGAAWLREPGKVPSVAEVLRLLEWDSTNRLIPEFEARYDNEREEGWAVGRLFDTRVFPFLSETSLILEGQDFSNPCCLFFQEGTLFGCGGRDWGGLVAAWANRTNWNRPVSEAGREEDWNYANCAFGLAGQIRDYGSWKDAVLEILRLSTAAHVRMAELKESARRLR